MFEFGLNRLRCSSTALELHRSTPHDLSRTKVIAPMASIFQTSDGTWRAQIRRKGLPAVSQNFDTKTEAQKWARAKEHEFDQNARIPAGLRVTIAELADGYLEQMRGRAMGITKRATIKRLHRELGQHRLEEVNKRLVLNFAQKRENEGAGPSTIQQDLVYLVTLLKFGGAMADAEEAAALALVQVGAAKSLLTHAKRIAPSNQRDRRPTTEELERLMQHCAKHTRSSVPLWDIIQFARCTAMRLGEIVGSGGITWEDLNVRDRTLLVRNRKDPKHLVGNNDLIPLLRGPVMWNSHAVDPVELLLRQRTAVVQKGRIFPHVENTVGQSFAQACEAVGANDLHFHDLRHDAISLLFEAGYTIPEVALVSGHKNWKSLQRYTNLKPKNLHK